MVEIIIKAFDNSLVYAHYFKRIFFAYIRDTSWRAMLVHLVILIIIAIVLYALKLLFSIFMAKLVSRKKVRYCRVYEGGKKILVVGDSTAVGTGAKSADDTIAGRLAKDFPRTDILNLGVNSALTRGVLSQLKKVKDKNFDMIIISVGGNDVWNFTRLSKLAESLKDVLDAAKEMSGHRVIVLFFGNDGSAPFFPFFMRKILMKRTAKVQDIFIKVTTKMEVPLIRLFTTSDDNPFVKDPYKYFAKDGLHPSSEGYWIWYKRMWRVMSGNKYLYYENDADYNPSP